MDAAADDELRELRARAYGRHADIAEDPAAVRRLQALESARSAADVGSARSYAAAEAAAPGVDPSPAPPSSVSQDVAVPQVPEQASWDEVAASDADTGADPRSDLASRRRTIWWAASVVASAALAAVVTFTLASIPPVSSSSGAPQIETLRLAGASDRIPEGWFGAEGDSKAADFLGYTVFTIPGWYVMRDAEAADPQCIAVLRTDEIPPPEDFDPNGWSFGGDVFTGCGVETFPATVEVPIRGGAPKALTDRYPSGVALQFVLDGDRVGVFLDSSAE